MPFLFTESKIMNEVNSGEVPGLFAKDEMMAKTANLGQDFLRDWPEQEETQLTKEM